MAQPVVAKSVQKGRESSLLLAACLLVTLLAVVAALRWGRQQQTSASSVSSIPVRAVPAHLSLQQGRVSAVIPDGWTITVLRGAQAGRTAGDTTQFNLLKLSDLGLQGGRRVTPAKQRPTVASISPPPAAILPDGNHVVWARDRILFWTANKVLSGVLLPDEQAPLETRFAKLDSEPVAMHVTDGGRLVIAFADSHVEVRDGIPGEILDSQKTSSVPHALHGLGQRLAVLCDASVLLLMPDITEAGSTGRFEWKVGGLSIAASPAGRVALGTADGTVLLLPAPGAANDGQLTLPAPGPVRAIAFLDEDRLIVGGDFRGLHLIDVRGATAEIYAEPVGVGIVAVEGDQVAYATATEIRTLVIRATAKVSDRGFLIGGVWIALISLLFARIRMNRRAMPHPDEVGRPTVLQEGTVPSPVRLPPPTPPDELIRACLSQECVLYAGAGLSAQAGFPTWLPFIRGLIDWSRERGSLDPDLAESLAAAVAEGQADSAADAIIGALPEEGREALRRYLIEQFSWTKSSLPQVHQRLREIPFVAALTTNFDDLLEQVWPAAKESVLTHRDTDRLREALAHRTFFLLKLYGTLQRLDTLLVAPAEYTYAAARSLQFAEFVQGLFVSRTILFVGSSLEGIEAYLSALSFGSKPTRSHYALVNVQGTIWQPRAEVLRRRYGIVVLPYTASPGFPEVPEFLGDLATAVTSSAVREKAASGVTEPGSGFRGLKQIRLMNIGPFVDLTLDLHSSWNVLLGDNGVGKSTILKAIALGLCGREAEPFAVRLIRTGEPSGSIVLETGSNTYRIDIRRRDAGAELTVSPSAPLGVEGWLAIGFPPLRTISWGRLKGPTSEGHRSPSAQDLLPLVRGEPDPRMDEIKQWIVNLDSRIHDVRGDPAVITRCKALLDRFSKTVDLVTPGLEVKFSRVDRETYQVWMHTDDGEVPIESISQGTTSLISWIGILLQRFFEVSPDSTDPTQDYALVLIDELDAHMHPEWQRSVVGDLRAIFPNAQFIVTTHSPLVVGGLPADQVIRFQRGEKGRIKRAEVRPDMTMGRADQLLTSGLFGLRTTLDQETQRQIDEYQRLLGQSNRSLADEAEYERLRDLLRFRIPVSMETPPERKAFELVQAILRDQIRPEFAEARDDLAQKARALLDAVSHKKEPRA